MISTKLTVEDTSTGSKLRVLDELFCMDYNFATALEVGSESSVDVDLTESIKRNKELMKGIKRAKRQITEGELLTYDAVF